MTTWCRDCPWQGEFPSRVVADLELEKHRREHEKVSIKDRLYLGTLELIAKINSRVETAVDRPDPHVHSFRCTYEVCGVGPTREDLVAMTKMRYGRR